MNLKDFEKLPYGVLYVPKEESWETVGGVLMPRDVSREMNHSHKGSTFLLPEHLFDPTPLYCFLTRGREVIKPAEDFETNLAEALTGWKTWEYTRCLHSIFDDSPWNPGVPYTAKCESHCSMVPNEHHTCGVYAHDKRDESYGIYGQKTIHGEVWGWGRYVRGGDGWRSEFAYPKSFHLEAGQERFVEPLKKYGVPIHMKIEVRVFDPEEEGYDEYRQDTPDGSCGAAEDSCSQKDSGS